MSNPELPSATVFPNKTPLNQTEKRLVDLQIEADEIGFALWEKAKEMHSDEISQERMQQLRAESLRLIDEEIGINKAVILCSRYFYELTNQSPLNRRIEYPCDSLHYFAYIEGSINDVKPLLVEHPSLDRKGDIGYRLCAEIDATRVAGWIGSEVVTLSIAVPVGEIYSIVPSYEIGKTDALIL